MNVIKVEYTVRGDYVETNKENIKAVMNELKKLNETAERIAGVEDWRGLEVYTKRERAALAWAEAVTNIQDGHAPDVVYDTVRAHFSEVETVNLTLVITKIGRVHV